MLRKSRSRYRDLSFAPAGLGVVGYRTHGLRRGLYSCAAPRLVYCGREGLRYGLYFYPPPRQRAGFAIRRLVMVFARCP